MQKIFFLIVVLSFLVAAPGVLAQDSELPSPGITPDSPFYFLDTLAEKIGMFFTFDIVKKAEKAFQYAGEKLAEVRAMAGANKVEALKKDGQKYQEYLSLFFKKGGKASEEGREVKELERISKSKSLDYLRVLADTQEESSAEAKTEVEKIIKVSRESFGETIWSVHEERMKELREERVREEPKGISCTINSDCGADACRQERNFCFEIRYICESGKCSSAAKEYDDYSCANDYYGSINFTGGTILEVEYKKVRPETRVIAEKLADLFGSIFIQPTGEKGIILKMKHIDEATHQQVLQRLGEVEEKYFESVRGTIDYSKCMDTCGDDICRIPETKDWCPEDCELSEEEKEEAKKLINKALLPASSRELPVVSPTTEESVIGEETADWKIYQNEKYGFEVKYPSYFRLSYITSLGDPELEKIVDDLNKGLPSFKGVPEDDGLYIHIMAFNSLPETSDEPIEFVLTKKAAQEERQKLEQSAIGDPWQFRSEKPYGKVIGTSGRKAAQYLKFSPQWGGYNAYFITYNNDGERIELSVYLKSLTKEEAEKEARNVIFNQILSTFKFTPLEIYE